MAAVLLCHLHQHSFITLERSKKGSTTKERIPKFHVPTSKGQENSEARAQAAAAPFQLRRIRSWTKRNGGLEQLLVQLRGKEATPAPPSLVST